jgi:hypothetical protein
MKTPRHQILGSHRYYNIENHESQKNKPVFVQNLIFKFSKNQKSNNFLVYRSVFPSIDWFSGGGGGERRGTGARVGRGVLAAGPAWGEGDRSGP